MSDTITISETFSWPDIPDGGPDVFERMNAKFFRPLRADLFANGCTSKLRRHGNTATLEVTGPASAMLDLSEMLRPLKAQLDELCRKRAEQKERHVSAFLDMLKGSQAKRERDAAGMLLDELMKHAARKPT
jgi:hypothetical protein